ncbi:MAG TPA: hypothetical protein VFI65_19255 [Streptosporangiaceae bacterium]|nr:hypothetical protein [Streptosporangiaceae bacterium]
MTEDLTWPSRAAALDGESRGIDLSADLTELFRQHHVELVRLAALLVRNDRQRARD